MGKEEVLAGQRKDRIVTKLHNILAPFLLRRVKDDVIGQDVRLKIPPKAEVVVFCGMTDLQKDLYESIMKNRIREKLEELDWTVDGTDNPEAGTLEKTNRLSNKLMQARKVCCHPYLFGEPRRVSEDIHTDERIVSSCGKLQVRLSKRSEPPAHAST